MTALVAGRRRPSVRLVRSVEGDRRDPRYGSRRWQRVRLQVLNRDMWTCRIVEGCTERATVADHIHPVYPAMPDGMFFGMGNLRGGCRRHNIARGLAASLEETTAAAGSAAVVTKDYSK